MNVRETAGITRLVSSYTKSLFFCILSVLCSNLLFYGDRNVSQTQSKKDGINFEETLKMANSEKVAREGAAIVKGRDTANILVTESGSSIITGNKPGGDLSPQPPLL